jgi:hypothetical protein
MRAGKDASNCWPESPPRMRLGGDAVDGWQNVADACTRDTSLGLHVLDLHAASIGRSRAIDFTFQ